jgi:hypothetical protein
LSEGFHFAASGEGIVNMVLELPMKVIEMKYTDKVMINVFTYLVN